MLARLARAPSRPGTRAAWRRRRRLLSALAPGGGAHTVLPSDGRAPRVLLTAEHASNDLPAPWEWSASDAEHFSGRHWAVDIGTDDFCRELAAETGACALLAGVSRLLVDVNRPPEGADTLFRAAGDGRAVELNASLGDEERAERMRLFYEPYHAELRRLARAVTPEGDGVRAVISLHSFTPVYEGQPRDVEIGVLARGGEHDPSSLASRILRALSSAGFDTRFNEPWSAAGGFMYAADRGGEAAGNGAEAVMLELRQDLAVLPAFRARCSGAIADVLRGAGLVAPLPGQEVYR